MSKQTPYEYMMQALERSRKRGDAPRMDNGDVEHEIQCECVRWFRMQYPQYGKLLFAVPNGGFRNKATAGKMKAEGVLAGVSDLILLVPSGNFHALCIEMKWEKVEYDSKGKKHVFRSYQHEEQKQWQKAVEEQGYQYSVCRSVDEFMSCINNYLNQEHR